MNERPERPCCQGCGVELPARALRSHVCDWWRWLDHQVAIRDHELQRFETELGDYLGTPRGRFELWCAERDRLRAA